MNVADHPEDRGFARLQCHACSWTTDGSTVRRKDTSWYTGGPCAKCGADQMKVLTFVCTNPYVDLARFKSVLERIRQNVDQSARTYHAFIGIDHGDATLLCDVAEQALEALEDMVRQHASGLREGQDVNGCGLSTNADAILLLEKVGRLKVTGGQGRCIYGVWNDAEKKA